MNLTVRVHLSTLSILPHPRSHSLRRNSHLEPKSIRRHLNPHRLPFLNSSMASAENREGSDQPEEFFSVWALPPADVKGRLKSLMSSLRSEFGGPSFDPHITVVGNVRLRRRDAVTLLRSAAASLKPFIARVSAVASGDFFYQCVYLLIDPSPEVVETSSHCCGHFGFKASTPYMPHVSLIYGDLGDEEKERARKRAEELDREISGLTFEVSSLALCKTDTADKNPESWEMVELYELK